MYFYILTLLHKQLFRGIKQLESLFLMVSFDSRWWGRSFERPDKHVSSRHIC